MIFSRVGEFERQLQRSFPTANWRLFKPRGSEYRSHLVRDLLVWAYQTHIDGGTLTVRYIKIRSSTAFSIEFWVKGEGIVASSVRSTLLEAVAALRHPPETWIDWVNQVQNEA